MLLRRFALLSKGENMFCPNCGNQIDVNQKFCTNCGAPIQVTETVENPTYAEGMTFEQQTSYQQSQYQQSQYQQSQYQQPNYPQYPQNQYQYQQSSGTMSAKTTSLVAYLTWIGLLIAFLAGDREGAKFHLNQALVIMLFGLLGMIPFIGWIWSIFIFICWIIGLIAAINQTETEVPLIGKIRILK